MTNYNIVEFRRNEIVQKIYNQLLMDFLLILSDSTLPNKKFLKTEIIQFLENYFRWLNPYQVRKLNSMIASLQN